MATARRFQYSLKLLLLLPLIFAVLWGILYLSLKSIHKDHYLRWEKRTEEKICFKNLRNIRTGMMAYSNHWKTNMPAWTTDVEGKKAHSWRTLILRHLDEVEFNPLLDCNGSPSIPTRYIPYHYDLSWDLGANKHIEAIPSLYRCKEHEFVYSLEEPGYSPPGFTTSYVAIIREENDPTIIAVIEMPGSGIAWHEPNDLSRTKLAQLLRNSKCYWPNDRVRVLWPNGTVEHTTCDAILKKLGD